LNRKITLMAVLAAALIFGTADGLCAVRSGPVEVAADTIDYDATTGVINAKGGVSMTQDAAVLTGANAEYNVKTQESHITGGVKVIKEDMTMTAAEVKGYGNSRFVATGNAVLVKGQNTLTGPLIDYDAAKQYALVPQSAYLSMPDGTMTADRLEAFINENRAAGSGNVHIVSDTRHLDATSDNAVYYGGQEQQQGKVVLTGNARAVQEGNVLTGETLTIRLDDKTIDAQGRPRLVVQPQ
jgi:lipopolysaccharide export system protein LptA